MTSSSSSPEVSVQDRFLGCLVGLAVGDALGTTLEFKHPGSFTPITDMVGGGPFDLQPGEWTDDTSMALCLAESLLKRLEFDPRDQCERYIQWMENGHLSSNGRCFDIGNTVSAALRSYRQTGDPHSGPAGERDAGNGSIMRLAPVPMFFASDPQLAIEMAGASSRTTHQTRACIDACRYMAGILTGIFRGESKDTVLSAGYHPVDGIWAQHELCPQIAEVAAGTFITRQPPAIRGSGYVVESLEAALWAFHHSENFRHGALLAVNLGDDADTTGAIYGQLAGAWYGIHHIPTEWCAAISHSELVHEFAIRLYRNAFLAS